MKLMDLMDLMDLPRSSALKLSPGLAFGLALGFTLGAAGCHSASIDATLVNATGKPVSLIQVDYPSASFGLQTLKPGENFKYRFTVLGAGPIKLDYTDAAHKDHKATGPALREGSNGALRIVLANDGVHWEPAAFPHS
jgi:hypothetical protein